MKRMLCLVFLLSACATGKSELGGGSPLACGIRQQPWPAAARDFDRHRTLATLGSLGEIARADRERLKIGQQHDIGMQLDELYHRDGENGAFVSAGVAELGTRLRQLDCAVRTNHVEAARADALYAQILAELAAEHATLDPGAGAPRAVAP